MIKKIVNVLLLLLLSNIIMLTDLFKFTLTWNLCIIFLLSIFFIIFNIRPVKLSGMPKKLQVLAGGYELLNAAIIIFIAEIAIYLILYLFIPLSIPWQTAVINAVISVLIFGILMWNGFIRSICTSSQLKILLKVLIIIVWWIPVINLFFLFKCKSVIRRELIFESSKIELNHARKENETCKTKYPILLVHGIFWRDWQIFNYWGRIPKELIKNGATVYYGNQQSAARMEICAGELKDQILNILAKEKCDKVNIIAHSKGGLDARYAISCLGMDEYVSSLTTICTPHHGCKWVDQLLKIIPDKIVLSVAKKYNSVYKKLGDTSPDFFSGVYDLTSEKCRDFNQTATNKNSVIYQSVASKMKSIFSAGFPLNIGYALVRHREGENDGFVSIESSKWGEFLGCYSPKMRRGISHGDMIDLMRENIRGFDVCELYVDIAKGLKLKNL